MFVVKTVIQEEGVEFHSRIYEADSFYHFLSQLLLREYATNLAHTATEDEFRTKLQETMFAEDPSSMYLDNVTMGGIANGEEFCFACVEERVDAPDRLQSEEPLIDYTS